MGMWCTFLIFILFLIEIEGNSVDPDQTRVLWHII